ncbi:MAG: D-2-hydroxyacid dehydrogenase [Xanthobacteraceae bacterium]
MTPTEEPLVHFETLSDRPRVFHITDALVSEAKSRNRVSIPTSVGEDLRDMSWLNKALGLVTHNDVLLNPKFPLRNLQQVAPKLRWIHVTGAGIEPLLPFDWLPQHVVFTNNSGVHAEKIRESAAMMLLMLNARVPAILSNQRKAIWRQIFTPAIRGKILLIVGVGEMGGAAALAARQLGLRVLGTRRSGAPHPSVDEMFHADDLDSALPLADFVLLSAPLTSETQTLMDRRRFGLMKPGAGFINIGRGGLADHAALADCLRVGSISGAVLDVYDPEPLPSTSPLWSVENLVMMPHVTSDDEDEYLPRSFDLAFENLRRLIAGKELRNVIDRKRGY